MARSIVRLTHSQTGETYYFGWSGGCDAPTTNRMTEEELLTYLEAEDYQEAGAHWLIPAFELNGPYSHLGPEALASIERKLAYLRNEREIRLERLRRQGTTFCDNPASSEESVKFNRAGKREGCISVDAIIELYK
ncbi:MAG: hypothetical protein JSS66_07390 [Armatimonadetes bacterium]|nr:hypothetical protein [Armatimonadota bacterium]